MYNLRNDKKNDKISNNNKTKTQGNKNSTNMLGLDNLQFTPANKHLSDMQQRSVAGSSRLSIAESPFKILNCVDKRLERFSAQIQCLIEEKFKEFKEDLLDDLRQKYIIVEEKLHDLNERFTVLEKQTAGEMESMRDEINALKTKLSIQENSHVMTELRLSGIPYAENEDPVEIFKKICSTINICPPNIRSAHRIMNHKINKNDGVIIVKLWSIYDKNFFLKNLARYRKLRKGSGFHLNDFGFDCNGKFFLNENLTQSNFNIFRAALRLKRNKRLCSVFTMRGFVYIKRQINDDPLRIDGIEKLNQLFPAIEGSVDGGN